MSLDDRYGMCHICGEMGMRTYEHIPPRSLGNDRPRNSFSAVEMLKQGRKIDDTKGLFANIQQQGSGRYSLCNRCNSYMGTHYVPAYNRFCVDMAGTFIQASKERGTGNFITVEVEKVDGLAVFKQILAMLCSLSEPGTLTDCREFLLDKDNTSFNKEKYQMFMYAILNNNSKSRSTGWYMPVYTDLTFCQFTDYAQFPLGYRLYDMENPPKRYYGCNITGLSELPYGSKSTFRVELPIDDIEGIVPYF